MTGLVSVRKESLVLNPDLDPETALAMLSWQVDLGATEAIGDAPVNRYDVVVEAKAAKPTAKAIIPTPQSSVAEQVVEGIAIAKQLAAGAQDLIGLKAAMESFESCELKKGARNLVFADGNPAARVMIVGEAPGRDEDREGLPFVGKAGQLLDNMLKAIGMSRQSEDGQSSVYITNVVPWRPPQNRDPSDEEMAMLRPFLHRHIALVNPEILIPMGNIACQALLGKRGITRMRGAWDKFGELPALPMFHPAYLLRTPAAKRETWADLLAIKAKLKRSENVEN